MLHNVLKKIDALIPVERASAHCDIPCKIYDPVSAQLAALSVIRLLDLINEVEEGNTAQLIRLVQEKETHAEKVKHEIRIIWGDYFKAPQIEKFPDVHELVHKIMMTGSACKQTVSREKGAELLQLVNQFSEYFWATKDVETYVVTSPYPPAEQVVYPVLK